MYSYSDLANKGADEGREVRGYVAVRGCMYISLKADIIMYWLSLNLSPPISYGLLNNEYFLNLLPATKTSLH
ncbi:unnamed protein product [Onchocerca flexuosa]|uniref:Uncharacterized protein n=1 Tax=Onchocerca flexuosa TaxID=387005 RepID=A0A183H370_9BILA|nr:unnamed protein product [Onchocerca flexuosa]